MDDLLAGWSWAATPTPEGYEFVVKDADGNEWGKDYYLSYTSYCRLIDLYAQSVEKGRTGKKNSLESYCAEHRFETHSQNPKAVTKEGERLVRACIKEHLKNNVHPKELPTLGVNYVGA